MSVCRWYYLKAKALQHLSDFYQKIIVPVERYNKDLIIRLLRPMKKPMLLIFRMHYSKKRPKGGFHLRTFDTKNASCNQLRTELVGFLRKFSRITMKVGTTLSRKRKQKLQTTWRRLETKKAQWSHELIQKSFPKRISICNVKKPNHFQCDWFRMVKSGSYNSN